MLRYHQFNSNFHTSLSNILPDRFMENHEDRIKSKRINRAFPYKMVQEMKLSSVDKGKKWNNSTNVHDLGRDQAEKPKGIIHNHDLIGDPNPVSNLRPIKFHIPENESDIERKYRLKREEVQKWNDQFWQKHNTYFFEKKAAYVEKMKQKKLKDSNDNGKNVSADELSSFYAQFLNDNWNRHMLYNFEWYKKNASLVFLALQVKWSHLKQKIFSRGKKSV